MKPSALFNRFLLSVFSMLNSILVHDIWLSFTVFSVEIFSQRELNLTNSPDGREIMVYLQWNSLSIWTIKFQNQSLWIRSKLIKFVCLFRFQKWHLCQVNKKKFQENYRMLYNVYYVVLNIQKIVLCCSGYLFCSNSFIYK